MRLWFEFFWVQGCVCKFFGKTFFRIRVRFIKHFFYKMGNSDKFVTIDQYTFGENRVWSDMPTFEFVHLACTLRNKSNMFLLNSQEHYDISNVST